MTDSIGEQLSKDSILDKLQSEAKELEKKVNKFNMGRMPMFMSGNKMKLESGKIMTRDAFLKYKKNLPIL